MADINKFSGGSTQENTAPQAKVEYPKNNVKCTSAGHVLQFNNTEEGERVLLQNGNGNFLDMDEKNNNNLVSYNDTYILSDHNLVIKIGEDVKSDRACIQIIGDCNITVEGDMHTECEGDRYDQVDGNYQVTVGGVYSVVAEENMALESKNQMKLESNSYENKTTFILNDLSEGGSIKENVKGNYEVQIQKETATFSVKSQGDVRINADMCRYENVGGNYITDVGGKVRTNVDGNSHTCINGGAFEGMLAIPAAASYDLNVTTGDYKLNVGGNVDIDATEIYLN
jgi:hypothetical protein|tara:strand:+ start:4777 stop:5628 length:852 start_codon:yes stop_codon:yes gene_type:complete